MVSIILFLTRVTAHISLVTALLVAVGVTASAQTPSRPDRGIRPVGSYAVSDIENVSLSNGNVNVSIPLAGLPPMSGGKLSWTLRAVYNSKTWDVLREEHRIPLGPTFVMESLQQSDAGGWRLAGGYGILFRESRADFIWEPPLPGDPDEGVLQTPNWYKAMLQTPDGAEHELRPLGVSAFPGSRDYLRGYFSITPDTSGNPMAYYSFDGSFLWAVINPDNSNYPIRWEICLPDGTKITQRRNGIQRITDTNGNRIKMFSTEDSPGVVTFHSQDEATGREIQAVFLLNDHQQVRYQTVGQDWVSIDLAYGYTTVKGKTYTVTDDNGQGGTCQRKAVMPDTPLYVLRSITLPVTEPGQSQKQYSFTYNSDLPYAMVSLPYQDSCGQQPQTVNEASKGMGSLSQITMPMGASINYSYSLDSVHTQLGGPDGATKEVITSKTVVHDGISDIWNYGISEIGGSVSNPDSTSATDTIYPHNPGLPGYNGGVDGKAGLAYRTTTPDKIIDRHWILKMFSGGNAVGPGGLVTFNPIVDVEYVTLLNPGGQRTKTAAKKFDYDFNGNLIKETDYDWFTPPPPADCDAQGVPKQVPAGATVLRVIDNSYYNPANTAGDSNVYAKRLLGTETPLILNAPQETSVSDSGTQFSRSQFFYDHQALGVSPVHGNLTEERRRLIDEARWISTTHEYDGDGNLTSTTDPNLNVTTFVYDDSTHALPISVTVDPDPSPTATGDQLTTLTEYDFATGLVTSQTDPNGAVTETDYTNQKMKDAQQPIQDPYGRPGVITGPVAQVRIGGALAVSDRRTVVTRYHDNARKVEVWSDLNTGATVGSDGKLRSISTVDQLGRPTLTEASENGSTFTIRSRSAYEQMGRITYASNPTRDDGATTDGWTRTTRDNSGRVVEVATFDGATQPGAAAANWNGRIQSSYDTEQTTVTDQAGKKRKSVVDGLGRLVRIHEDPDPGGLNYQTSYTYDVLGNLIRVDQGTGTEIQVRLFTYDSLSRLRTAKNPEQVNTSTPPAMVATGYAYDDASNLMTRTNPNTSTVGFTYDGLNRVKTKTLSVGGAFTYSYDTAPNGKGRLASVTSTGGDGYYYDSYDQAGRILSSHQATTAGGVQRPYTMSYGYNLAGGMTTETYPSGKEVRTSYDSAGRTSDVSRYIANVFDKTYASGFSYTAHGAVTAMSLAAGKMTEQTIYNARLQPKQMDLKNTGTTQILLGLDYGYGTTTNNGNMLTQKIRIGGTTASNPTTAFNQTFTYDPLNRLDVATETNGWSQDYDYDRFGNRWVNQSTGFNPDPTLCPRTGNDISKVTNRITMPGFSYDVSGNQKTQTRNGQNEVYDYDSENRLLSVSVSSVQTGSYVYDGDGRRVTKTEPMTGTTVFVYNAGGQLLAEYTSGAAQPNGTSYLTTDHLGSTRIVTSTDAGGNAIVKARHDYLPFGEEIPSTVGRGSVSGYGASDSTRQRFTGKERDENALDYFLARYYSSSQGRFTSADPYDPVLARQGGRSHESEVEFQGYLNQPQHWDRFPYVVNNPFRYTDESGNQELEVIQKALSKSALPGPFLAPLVTQYLVGKILNGIFGPNIETIRGGLDPKEFAFAQEVADFTKLTFIGVKVRNEPGIDGVLVTPASLVGTYSNVKGVASLTETNRDNPRILLDLAEEKHDEAAKASYKQVDVFIKANSIDSKTALRYIDRGSGFTNITKGTVIRSINIFTNDKRVIKIEGDKVAVVDR